MFWRSKRKRFNPQDPTIDVDGDPLPDDPNQTLVTELERDFPYGKEQFRIRSMIRMIVWTVIQMKKRGMI